MLMISINNSARLVKVAGRGELTDFWVAGVEVDEAAAEVLLLASETAFDANDDAAQSTIGIKYN